MRSSMSASVTTPFMCPPLVALVECDPELSGSLGGRLKPEQAYRTGQVAHLKRELFATMFNVPIEENQACVFVEPGVIEQLQALVAPPPD